MTEKTEIPKPTQEIAEAYLKRVNDDVIIEARVKEIANKIDAIFKRIYRIDEAIIFDYTCFFVNQTLVFRLHGSTGKIQFPTLPTSCLWDETDLHINLNLLESDVFDGYV